MSRVIARSSSALSVNPARGKTTLAKTLLRLIEPSSGSAVVHDTPVAGKGVRIGYKEFLGTVQPIFPEPVRGVLPLSAGSTPICMRRPIAWLASSTRPRRAGRPWPMRLSLVGLDYADVHGKYTNQFSGGRVAARVGGPGRADPGNPS